MDKAKMILQVAQLVLKVVEDLRNLSDSVQMVCDIVMEGLSDGNEPKTVEEKPVKKKQPAISMEKVRGVLAQKSQEGYTAEIRKLLQQYGASKLSEIDPKNYKAILEAAEGLGDE